MFNYIKFSFISNKCSKWNFKNVSSCDTIISNLNFISCNKDETQIYNSCEDLSYSENSLKVIQENLIKLLETNPLIDTEDKTYYVSEYPSISK